MFSGRKFLLFLEFHQLQGWKDANKPLCFRNMIDACALGCSKMNSSGSFSPNPRTLLFLAYLTRLFSGLPYHIWLSLHIRERFRGQVTFPYWDVQSFRFVRVLLSHWVKILAKFILVKTILPWAILEMDFWGMYPACCLTVCREQWLRIRTNGIYPLCSVPYPFFVKTLTPIKILFLFIFRFHI